MDESRTDIGNEDIDDCLYPNYADDPDPVPPGASGRVHEGFAKELKMYNDTMIKHTLDR